MITTEVIQDIYIFWKRNIKSMADLQHSSSSKKVENWSGCWRSIFNCTVDQEGSEFTIQNDNYWHTTTSRNAQQQANQHEEPLQPCGISELSTVKFKVESNFYQALVLRCCQMF
jgi:hypothetical protein